MKLFITCSFVFSFLISYSQQNNLTEEKINALIELNRKIEGTYQVQMINTRKQPAIPIELAEKIESVRQENDTAFFFIQPDIKIVVLPHKTIHNKSFGKVEKIIYTTE